MDPLLSIIIPVYNVEEYLNRCIESIVTQTYSNLEIIIVDDGSTDHSADICVEWEKRDERIVVLQKDNGGQGSARNLGIRHAHGDYIGFVDSDDYIDTNMYRILYDCMCVSGCEIVECTMKRFSGEYNTEPVEGSDQVIVFNRKEAVKDFLIDSHLKCTVPNMLVAREIAEKVLFDEKKTHEDILWPYRAFLLANKVAFIDTGLYFYFQRPDSIMNRAYSFRRFDALDALEERAEDVKQVYPEMYHYAVKAYLGACRYQYQFLCRQKKTKEVEQYKETLYKRFRKGDQKALFKNLTFKHKMWYLMFRVAPTCTSLLCNRLKIGL